MPKRQTFAQVSFLTRDSSLAFLLTLPVGKGVGQTFLKPGDTGSIQFPIENDAASAGPADGAQISVTAPSYFIIKNTSIQGPASIAAGQTQTFVVDYEIGASAPEGAFDVTLDVTMTTENVDPDPATLTEKVSFNRDHTPPIMQTQIFSARIRKQRVRQDDPAGEEITMIRLFVGFQTVFLCVRETSLS